MNYLDTSVVVPLYCPESLSDRVEQFLLEDEAELVVSHLVEVEFFSALSMKVRRQKLTVEEATVLGEEFCKDLADKVYTSLEVETLHYRLAQEWISRFDLPLRTLDALHLAVAKTFELNLVTADAALAQSATVCGVTVHELRL